jgi:hypothetical protein
MADVVGLEVLTQLQGSSRYARSYAFLYAAFQGAASARSDVRDALDCLTPFIAAYTHGIAGRQVELPKLQEFLRTKFGFEIPIYALDQIFPSLRNQGYIEFKQGPNIWMACGKEDKFTVAKEEIETDFDEIVELLRTYAERLGLADAPPSGSWDGALIGFLKPDSIATDPKIVNLKSVLIDTREAEKKIVASFIKKMWEEQPSRYEKIVKIFMGILIEDFLATISHVGQINFSAPPVVLYDTTILLRNLGCSGRLFKTATDELTRYLQDIGCETKFLAGNESEVNNVISAILSRKDTGGELEGETAEAISRGEVSIADLRMLQNNFVDQLARMNVFEQSDTGLKGSTSYQINETAFANYLYEQSLRRGRKYGSQNRVNDAGYLGTVMRLWGPTKTRDFSGSKFVFVTSNRLLATASRAFLIQEKQLAAVHCPPILHHTQVATIAWLLKDKKLSPAIAGRELLVNCYAATRPDEQWFKSFKEGMEKIVGDLQEFAQNPGNNFVLQAARRIAQEESFGNSAVMRGLNAVELLDRSREYARSQEEKFVAQQKADIERIQTETQEASVESERALLQEKIRIWSERRAQKTCCHCKSYSLSYLS